MTFNSGNGAELPASQTRGAIDLSSGNYENTDVYNQGDSVTDTSIGSLLDRDPAYQKAQQEVATTRKTYAAEHAKAALLTDSRMRRRFSEGNIIPSEPPTRSENYEAFEKAVQDKLARKSEMTLARGQQMTNEALVEEVSDDWLGLGRDGKKEFDQKSKNIVRLRRVLGHTATGVAGATIGILHYSGQPWELTAAESVAAFGATGAATLHRPSRKQYEESFSGETSSAVHGTVNKHQTESRKLMNKLFGHDDERTAHTEGHDYHPPATKDVKQAVVEWLDENGLAVTGGGNIQQRIIGPTKDGRVDRTTHEAVEWLQEELKEAPDSDIEKIRTGFAARLMLSKLQAAQENLRQHERKKISKSRRIGGAVAAIATAAGLMVHGYYSDQHEGTERHNKQQERIHEQEDEYQDWLKESPSPSPDGPVDPFDPSFNP